MKRAHTSIAFLLLAVLAMSQAFAGAGNRAGTNGASELLIPVGTRDIAMGGSTLSTASGVEALFWNPAGTVLMKNSADLYISHMSYIADIGVSYGAVSANIEGFGVLSLGLKYLAVDPILVTTTRDPEGTGQTFQPQFFTVGLSYARQLSERIAVGITGNLISERLGDVSATGLAFDVGVLYDNLASIRGLSIAVVAKNIGPQMKYEGTGLLTPATVADQNRPATLYQIQAASFELPSAIHFGVGYKYQLSDEATVAGKHRVPEQQFLRRRIQVRTRIVVSGPPVSALRLQLRAAGGRCAGIPVRAEPGIRCAHRPWQYGDLHRLRVPFPGDVRRKPRFFSEDGFLTAVITGPARDATSVPGPAISSSRFGRRNPVA